MAESIFRRYPGIRRNIKGGNRVEYWRIRARALLEKSTPKPNDEVLFRLTELQLGPLPIRRRVEGWAANRIAQIFVDRSPEKLAAKFVVTLRADNVVADDNGSLLRAAKLLARRAAVMEALATMRGRDFA